MKKWVVFFMLMATFTVTSLGQMCSAKDVWVDRWDEVDSDIFVMEDTIIRGHNDEYISFRVAAKQVQNDNLSNVVLCDFVKWPDDAWRFRTSESDGTNFSAVATNDPVYEYCMQKLGWEYRLDNGLYY